MAWSFSKTVEIDPRRPFADQIAFDIEAADQQSKLIVTRITDRGFLQIPNLLTASIEFSTDTRAFVSLEYPSRYGSRMMTAVVFFVPGVWSLFTIFAVMHGKMANDVSVIPFMLMMIIFFPLWFWWATFIRKRIGERIATHLAYAAYHRIQSAS